MLDFLHFWYDAFFTCANMFAISSYICCRKYFFITSVEHELQRRSIPYFEAYYSLYKVEVQNIGKSVFPIELVEKSWIKNHINN